MKASVLAAAVALLLSVNVQAQTVKKGTVPKQAKEMASQGPAADRKWNDWLTFTETERKEIIVNLQRENAGASELTAKQELALQLAVASRAIKDPTVGMGQSALAMRWSALNTLNTAYLNVKKQQWAANINQDVLKQDFEVRFPEQKWYDLGVGIFKTQEEAALALEEVRSGKITFQELAKKSTDRSVVESEGNFLETPLSALPPEVALKVENHEGFVDMPVQTKFGFMIVNVKSVQTKRAKEFVDVEQILREERVNLELRSFIKELAAGLVIE